MAARAALVLALAALVAHARASASSAEAQANPIRKIVTLMQNMQKEIEAEGVKEKELFDKFMCFCGNSGGDLEKNIVDSRARVEELTAKLKSETAEKTQVAQDLIQAKKDRESAKHDLVESEGIRTKEAAEYAAMKADSDTNIGAMTSAIAAMEKGLDAAAFVQLPRAAEVHRLIESYPKVDDDDRRTALAFLDQTSEAGSSGAIVGVLKQMKDEMVADLKEATNTEEEAIASYTELKGSKEEEVRLTSAAIESKTARSGELAVSVVQTQDALEDEQAELADSEKFSANLKEQCKTKSAEWDERTKTRGEEIAAISEAISILNDDDALDTFKKAIPSAASAIQMGGGLGFLQRRSALASPLVKARAMLAEAGAKDAGGQQMRLMLFTVSSKLRVQQGSKTQNFKELLKMVDGMVALLAKQQTEDDNQKAQCNEEFDKADDEQKATKAKITNLEAAVAETTDAIAQVTDEISSLAADVASLDKAVAEATAQRKEEHAEYASTTSMNDVAKQLVAKAKNRMQKFYNPSLYKAPPTTTESSSPYGLIEAGVAPPEAPEAPGGAYKKNKGSAGILAMMDGVINDLDKGTQEAEMEEKTAQRDYNTLMNDSQKKRAENSESITNKEADKAELETTLETTKQNHRDAEEDLRLNKGVINDLHRSCDFLLQNYDVRKEARAAETDSLKNAQAVLNGANFGF